MPDMQTKKNEAYKGMLLMLACAVLWSLSGLSIKLVPWGSMVLAGWRGVFGAITLFVCMRLMKYKISISFRSVLIGVCVAATAFMFIVANRLTTAANAIVLQYTSPVWLVILSMVFLKKRYAGKDYMAVLFTVAGIALFFMDGLTPGGTLGNVIAIADGCCLAAVYMLIGESDESKRLSGVLCGMLLTSAIGVPFTFVDPPEITALSVLIVIVMGVFQFGLPYALYSMAINYCPPLACVLISSVEIVLNPVWVWLIVGETPDTFALIGSAVILVTITLWCALGGAKPKEGLPQS